jgi:hypothetical protein
MVVGVRALIHMPAHNPVWIQARADTRLDVFQRVFSLVVDMNMQRETIVSSDDGRRLQAADLAVLGRTAHPDLANHARPDARSINPFGDLSLDFVNDLRDRCFAEPLRMRRCT